MSFLCCEGHIRKQMYAVFSRLRLYSSKRHRKDYQASPSSPTSKMILKKVKATGRENTPPGHSLIVQMKNGEQDLERVYFHLRLCVFQSCNRMAVSMFVKNWLARPPNCQPFIVPFFIFLEGGLGVLRFRGF